MGETAGISSSSRPSRVARVLGWALVAGGALGAPEVLRACASCFGDPASGESRGVVAAGAVLLSVLLGVQLALARFFWRLMRRETELAREDESR